MTTTNLIQTQDMALRDRGAILCSLLPKGVNECYRNLIMEYDIFSLRRYATIILRTEGLMSYYYYEKRFQLPAIHEDIDIIEFIVRKITEFYFVVKG